MHTLPIGHTGSLWSIYKEVTDPDGPFTRDDKILEQPMIDYILLPFHPRRKTQDGYSHREKSYLNTGNYKADKM